MKNVFNLIILLCLTAVPGFSSGAPALENLISGAEPPVAVEDERLFFEIVRTAFQMRRKMLGGSIAESLGLPREALAAAMAARGVAPTSRAEELDLAGFEALARAVAEVRGG